MPFRAMNGYRYRELFAYPDCDTITDDSASDILVCARIGGRGAGVWRASGGGTVDYFAALTRNKRVSG